MTDLEGLRETDPERWRLRRQAKRAVPKRGRWAIRGVSIARSPRRALDAIALWTRLGEPDCLLCGKERDKTGTIDCGCGLGESCMRLTTVRGPDAGSVLCSKCRRYPTHGKLEWSVGQDDPKQGVVVRVWERGGR